MNCPSDPGFDARPAAPLAFRGGPSENPGTPAEPAPPAAQRAADEGRTRAAAPSPGSPAIDAGRRELEAQRQFELTARAAGIGYWSSDAATHTPQWNERTYRLHGLPPDAPAVPMSLWLERFVHPDDREHLSRQFADWIASGEPLLENEFRIVRADGAVRRLLSHARVERTPAGADLFGVLQDVTEKRAAEAALREAAERVGLATRGAGIGIWEQDLITGIGYWDEQMWRLRGLQPQPVAPALADRLEIVHPDDRGPMLAESARAAEENRLSMVEFRVRWPDGQLRWLASRATVVRDASGKPVRRIGLNWDITEARGAQLAREQSLHAQRESQAKSRFLSRMSHELRTPLNAVLGFTQLLLAGGERLVPETRRRHLEQVELAGKHLLSLIDDVLDLSSLEGGELRIEPQSVALAPLVERTLPLVARLARQHKVRVRAGPLAGTVRADPTRLRQVLLNLLTNAVKYNREGGQVWVESRVHGGQVALTVADTGRGMDEAQLRQAFEPFNRLGREHEGIEGTGIGLPIVRSLVESMGGRIDAHSRPGEGSRFEVHLPAADPDLVDGDPEPAAPRTPPPLDFAPSQFGAPIAAGSACLLYIEDNPVNVILVQELAARRPQLQFASAADGAEGVARARALRPDLILLDMHLPDADGHEVLRRLRADPTTASIPCIALSADALPAEIERALRAGFADYWTKPIDFSRFEHTMAALFGDPPASG
jgi:signal transduction histidine kinase/CheY-like chemotaxis protein